MSRHLGRVSALKLGMGEWKPLRGRPPERISKPGGLSRLILPVAVGIPGLPYLGQGGWYPVLRQVLVVAAIWMVWDAAADRRCYARHVCFAPGSSTLTMTSRGDRRVALACALREHLGIKLWTAWRLAGLACVPLVVDVDPATVAGAGWALTQAGAVVIVGEPGRAPRGPMIMGDRLTHEGP